MMSEENFRKSLCLQEK